jgi:hypothetical protein
MHRPDDVVQIRDDVIIQEQLSLAGRNFDEIVLGSSGRTNCQSDPGKKS